MFILDREKFNQNSDCSLRSNFNIHYQISIVRASENTILNIKSGWWFNPHALGFYFKHHKHY